MKKWFGFRKRDQVENKEMEKPPKKKKVKTPPVKPDPLLQGRAFGWPSEGMSKPRGRGSWITRWRD